MIKMCIRDSIDTNRIYLGGDSNGGFMTMKMLIRNPGRYAAAFPVCEALDDSAITVSYTHLGTEYFVKKRPFLRYLFLGAFRAVIFIIHNQ